MRTAAFQFSESGGSVNGPNLFAELPFLYKSLPNPSFTELPHPFSLKNPFLSLKSASSHPLEKNRHLILVPVCFGHPFGCLQSWHSPRFAGGDRQRSAIGNPLAHQGATPPGRQHPPPPGRQPLFGPSELREALP